MMFLSLNLGVLWTYEDSLLVLSSVIDSQRRGKSFSCLAQSVKYGNSSKKLANLFYFTSEGFVKIFINNHEFMTRYLKMNCFILCPLVSYAYMQMLHTVVFGMPLHMQRRWALFIKEGSFILEL